MNLKMILRRMARAELRSGVKAPPPLRVTIVELGPDDPPDFVPELPPEITGVIVFPYIYPEWADRMVLEGRIEGQEKGGRKDRDVVVERRARLGLPLEFPGGNGRGAA